MSTRKTVLLPLVALSLLVSASALLAAPIVLTFDDLPSPGGALTDQYGLTWGPGWGYYDTAQGPDWTPSSPPARAYPTGGGSPWTFSFPSPKVFSGAYFNGYAGPEIQFNLYTLVNGVQTFVASSGVLTLPGGGGVFLSSGCTQPISIVEVSASSNRWIMDDVTYADTAPTALTVPIDILPRDRRNVINLNENSVVTVAILSTATFDATTVDVKSVLFAGANALRAHVRNAERNHRRNLILQFRISDLDLDAGATEATLTGTTKRGQAIQGTDNVQVIAKRHCGKR